MQILPSTLCPFCEINEETPNTRTLVSETVAFNKNVASQVILATEYLTHAYIHRRLNATLGTFDKKTVHFGGALCEHFLLRFVFVSKRLKFQLSISQPNLVPNLLQLFFGWFITSLQTKLFIRNFTIFQPMKSISNKIWLTT